jgi:hypothetical protein
VGRPLNMILCDCKTLAWGLKTQAAYASLEWEPPLSIAGDEKRLQNLAISDTQFAD